MGLVGPEDQLLLFRLPGPEGLLGPLLPEDRSRLLGPGDLLLPGGLALPSRLPDPGGLLGPLLQSLLPGPGDRLLLFHPVDRDILESPAVRGVLAVP